MKIGVLTSSRADFGIYLPLLKMIKADSFFQLEIIAFGTHLSKKHGYTLSEIKTQKFNIIHKIKTIPATDTSKEISKNIGETIIKFSSFWENNKYDLVFCLGDRYEMFAAVMSGTPFNINFAHIHAGETTLGAIDNIYRHSISLASKVLFVSTNEYKKRAKQLVESKIPIHNVGALSIDNLTNVNFLTKKKFYEKFKIDLTKPSILCTFHPETVSFEKNKTHIKELLLSLEKLKKSYQIIITMPNTDTSGIMIRKALIEFQKLNKDIILHESFGMLGYLSCMKHCSFLLGNTSSGFVEASYFPKFVINVGDRQKGRIITDNIISIPVKEEAILNAVTFIENTPKLISNNIYGNGNSAKLILKKIKQLK